MVYDTPAEALIWIAKVLHVIASRLLLAYWLWNVDAVVDHSVVQVSGVEPVLFIAFVAELSIGYLVSYKHSDGVR